VGDTEHNIREVFRKARAAAPSVIFLDEFDAMARRDTGHESLSPVTALLTEMDGLEGLTGVVVLAATNRPQVIDKALLRPGRIGKLMYVGPPNLHAREQILHINTKDRPVHRSVDLEELARATDKWSGAEVAELTHVAAWHARVGFEADASKDCITKDHFDAAFGEIKPGISESLLEELQSWSVSGVDQVVV
jgi:AAA family ATPase